MKYIGDAFCLPQQRILFDFVYVRAHHITTGMVSLHEKKFEYVAVNPESSEYVKTLCGN